MIIGVFVALALLTGASAQVTGCPDVQIVGVRGSGQAGFGEQVGDVISPLQANIRAAGRSVSSYALEYPAISISDSLGLVLLNGAYDNSVQRGAQSLRVAVDEISIECPETQMVLIGYSQGAQVIKVAMENTVPYARVAAVVLLADPTRDPEQPGIRRLGGRVGLRGGSFGPISLPEYLRPVAVDVCASDDGICERGRFDLVAHIDGYGEFSGAAARQVMPLIVSHPVKGLRFL